MTRDTRDTGAAARDLIADLRRSLPSGAVLDDPELVASYETDITGRYAGSASAVARPSDAEQVATAVAACADAGVPLVVQGGNTGLVGGSVPQDGELVLSLARLDWIGPVDGDANQLDVGAGATLEAVQKAAAVAGLRLPIDHAARSAATIGGMVATDAGGALALRHGTMRRRVVGLETVLADGSVVTRMAGLLKDNAGYDVPAIVIGSEGTLGAITAARLQLEPPAPFQITALFGVPDLRGALDLLGVLRKVPGLEAADFLDAPCMELVCDRKRLRDPLPSPWGVYVVAQCAAAADVTAELATHAESLPAPSDVVAATDTEGRERLWAYRELLNETLRGEGVPLKFDIGLPLAAIPTFDEAIRARLASSYPDARLYIYGHVGDGNVHVNVLDVDPEDEGVDELVLRCAAELGGTISAEHGVGLAKRRYLSLCRSVADIRAMRSIKSALDPAGTFAPGRVLPGPGEKEI